MEIELKAKAYSKYNIHDVVSYRLFDDSDICYLGFIVTIQTTFHEDDNSFTFEYLVYKLSGTVLDAFDIDIVREENIICAISLDEINRIHNEFFDKCIEKEYTDEKKE